MSDSKRVTVAAVSVASVAVLSLLAALPAGATPQMLSQAKAAGMPAQNCQYCHTVAMPKKEGFTPDELNERGKWLVSEKDKQKAKDIKGDWLKNYPGGK
jgi:mono/diheme cytochrome c family protein